MHTSMSAAVSRLEAWGPGLRGDVSDDPRPADTLVARIEAAEPQLTRQFRAIANHVAAHRATLAMIRIQDLAAGCGVQPSAVVRFAQHFGYSGYASFKQVFVSQACKEHSEPVSPILPDVRMLGVLRDLAKRLIRANYVECHIDDQASQDLLIRCLKVAGVAAGPQQTGDHVHSAMQLVAVDSPSGMVIWLDGVLHELRGAKVSAGMKWLGLQVLIHLSDGTS